MSSAWLLILGICLPDISYCNVGMLKYVIPWQETIIYTACSISALSYEVPCYLRLDKPVTAPDKVLFFNWKVLIFFSKFSMKTYVVVHSLEGLTEMLLMSTQNIHLYREIRKICGFPFLSGSIQAFHYHAYNLLVIFISHRFTHFCCCCFYA